MTMVTLHETPGSLHDALVEQWGSDIASGRRAPGSKIASDQAAAELGVSRTVVREAVRVLESLGLVEVRQRVGITVRRPEHWIPYDPRVLRWRLAGPDRMAALRSLSELRSAVEPLAARLAAERATPKQCGELAAAVIGMAATSRAANMPAYLEHDKDFHLTLLQASGNPMLAGLSTVVTSVLEGRTEHALMPAVADAEALRLHGEVAAAVQAGAGAAAEASMRAIVAESADAIEQAVSS
ncbi:GntR family transcriptional regulator [Microlunatus phosphovorus NM-1]|jgi:DNA-binding FadR family transcriptional regulator|uniref:GntR family transcriptional regulator n=2 Tax=Microlunatus phosphovorus TaxID=29405 RepID=F5XPN9_MICPN|nr:GntR family transcriptional regulator [Microlunatus phosphovorus NM-1]